jgi:D-alanyl-D-alanine carboxypeptidase
VDAIADVTQRIADIQTKLSSMRPPAVTFADVLQTTSGSGPGTTSGGQPSGLDESALAAASLRPGWATASPGGAAFSGGGAISGRGASTGGSAGTARTPGATEPAAGAAPVRGTGGVTVPDELRAYGNGRIPAAALEKLGQGSHRLAAKAAGAWQRMEAAAAADGVRLRVTDSYRDYDTQVDLVRRKGLYSQGGLAAKPGTSDHGWGLAVDLDLNREQQAWMRANAARFGFVEDTPREPWHWGFHG